jgi:hypothetical protein
VAGDALGTGRSVGQRRCRIQDRRRTLSDATLAKGFREPSRPEVGCAAQTKAMSGLEG